MTTAAKTIITISAVIKVPVEKAWKFWTAPEHIIHWNFASDDWHCPWVENDLRPGGKFSWRMEAKDGSMGFDFAGMFDEVRINELIVYTMGDGRKAKVTFAPNGNETTITEIFDAENTHSAEMQRAGWQAILDNFKKHAEAQL